MARCDSYDPGQCTAGACDLNSWVQDWWGNGGSWADSARNAGFTVTNIPTVDSVVCYCSGDGYSVYGHVATVKEVYPDGRFLVREENFNGPYLWDDRVSTQDDVCGFILPPGISPGQGGGGGSGGPPGSTLGWAPGVGEVVAAYDHIRWYFNVTLDQQQRSLADQVSLSYQIGV